VTTDEPTFERVQEHAREALEVARGPAVDTSAAGEELREIRELFAEVEQMLDPTPQIRRKVAKERK
jgi:hypothetical protein